MAPPSSSRWQRRGDDELHALLQTLITRLMRMRMRRGMPVEDTGQTYLAELDGDGEEARALRPLHAAAATCRLPFGPRAGQTVRPLRGAMPRDATAGPPLCADIGGFSLHAAVRVSANDRKRLERLPVARRNDTPGHQPAGVHAVADGAGTEAAAGDRELEPVQAWPSERGRVRCRRGIPPPSAGSSTA